MRSQRRQPDKRQGKTKSPKPGPKAARSGTARVGRWGRRYSEEQRAEALKLIAAGMHRRQVAKTIGASTETLRLWVNKAKKDGTMPDSPSHTTPESTVARSACRHSTAETDDAAVCALRSPGASRDHGLGLGPEERDAILEVKRRHPSMGPAQIRAQLKRHKGWRLAIRAIARVLTQNGYELVHRGARPKGDDPIRFEAPRPNALWQADFGEFHLPGEKLHVLLILDDFSRFCVGHAVATSPTSIVATSALRAAIALHGKPEKVRTDRGGAFLAKTEQDDFARVLEAELIDHIIGHSYHPQGGGKVESLVGTLRRELWDVQEFASRAQAEARVQAWIREYNHRRAHMGIDGLTPADRYFGRASEVLEAIDSASRHRQGAIAQRLAAGDPLEEVLGLERHAPMEVLRLVLADGHIELRFLGARVVLGPTQF